jgi:2-dehydro-3-deoxyphosphogalactonate aldolase
MSSVAQRWQDAVPLIAILRGITPDDIEIHAAALIECGITLIEVPANSPDWQISVARAVKLAGNSALVGAGTVTGIHQVGQLAAAGGSLLVTPNTDAAVIQAGLAQGMVCAAGFATPTEAFAALKAGAQALKLFPASHYGTGYVRALGAVLPAQTPLFAVGGIASDNLAAYLQAGCRGAGLGNSLFTPGQAAAVTRDRARLMLGAYRRAQAERHASAVPVQAGA